MNNTYVVSFTFFSDNLQTNEPTVTFLLTCEWSVNKKKAIKKWTKSSSDDIGIEHLPHSLLNSYLLNYADKIIRLNTCQQNNPWKQLLKRKKGNNPFVMQIQIITSLWQLWGLHFKIHISSALQTSFFTPPRQSCLIWKKLTHSGHMTCCFCCWKSQIWWNWGEIRKIDYSKMNVKTENGSSN